MEFDFISTAVEIFLIFVLGMLSGILISKTYHYDGEFKADVEHPEKCDLKLHEEIKDVAKKKKLVLRVTTSENYETGTPER